MEGEGWWWACCVCDEGGLRTVCGREETGWLRGVVGREGEVKRALVHTLSVVIVVCEVLEVRVMRD